MREDLQKKLKIEYSEILNVGIECGDGWYELIWELLHDIRKQCKKKLLKCRVSQIKEKYGGLRLYYDAWSKAEDARFDDEIDNLIKEAEDKSLTICEECGAPGSIRKGGWINTLCDEHAFREAK